MNNQDNNTSFWVSYADLMAGLLFVFILLIGAIIIKYSLLESESKILEKNLSNEKTALERNKEELKRKEEEIKTTVITLEKTKQDLENLRQMLVVVQGDLDFSLQENDKLKGLMSQDKQILESQKVELLKQNEQLNLLEQIKKQNESRLDELNKNNESLTSNLDLTKLALKEKEDLLEEEKNINTEKSQTIVELNLSKEQLNKSLELLNLSVEEKNKKLNEVASDVLLKEKLLATFENKNQELIDELKVAYEKMKNIQSAHDLITQDLQHTKTKIKNLTGIKIKVITMLKNKLGKNMQIDPKNGAISLSSNILFDEGQFELKANSKEALKNAVYDYFDTILENEEINKHIDKIIIEGHTNSKGSFLYNLELSQKRAYSVMSFLLDLDFNKSQDLKELVVASGRSFLDPVYNGHGVEDKDKSRRIEIKFRLKNEEAIKEIESILDK